MANATTLPSGHSSQSERLLSEYPDKDIVVVYDTASYSYADIFDIFMSTANPNMTIGFYYADKNIIITPNEIVE